MIQVAPKQRENGRSRVFSHPMDVHCVIFHVVTLAAYAVAFWLWMHPEVARLDTWGDRVAFALGAGYLLGWISGIDVGVNFHNHTHRRIFRSARMNLWFGRIWTFSGGWPAFYWNHAHVAVHHSNLLAARDWTLPRRKPDGSFESVYRYMFLHWPWRYVGHLWKDFAHGRGGRRVQRKALKELAWFLALWSIPFWIDPVMAVALWIWPQWLGNAMVMGSGMYVQHAGAVPKSPERPRSHSNTYLSRFFNLTMFNIGYHCEHHDNPHVHWSELPALHGRLRERLVEKRAHVLPYGYYRAAHIVSAVRDPQAGYEHFVRDQAAGYGRPAAAPGDRLAEKVLVPIPREPVAPKVVPVRESRESEGVRSGADRLA